MRNLRERRKARFIDFRTDFAFKKFFGTKANKTLLIHFLNSLFELKNENQITDITYLNSEQLPKEEDERRAVFDVYCETNHGERFIVEMQKNMQKNFKNRSLFYATFPIQELSDRGNNWDFSLAKIFVIGVLDFTFDNQKPNKVITKVQFKDEEGDVFNDRLNFVYIELPKFHKEDNQLKTIMDEWLFLIKNLYRLRDRPKNIQSKIFDRLFSTAEICNLSKMEFKDYSRSLKDYRDWKNSLDYAIEQKSKKILKKTMAKGIAKGMEKGMAKGMAKGIKENQIESAKKMLDKNFEALSIILCKC